MHIDMSQLKFTDEADGWQKAVIDVVALTFGENGGSLTRSTAPRRYARAARRSNDALETGLST
jgi:hypothetical protein